MHLDVDRIKDFLENWQIASQADYDGKSDEEKVLIEEELTGLELTPDYIESLKELLDDDSMIDRYLELDEAIMRALKGDTGRVNWTLLRVRIKAEDLFSYVKF